MILQQNLPKLLYYLGSITLQVLEDLYELNFIQAIFRWIVQITCWQVWCDLCWIDLKIGIEPAGNGGSSEISPLFPSLPQGKLSHSLTVFMSNLDKCGV